MYHQGIYLPATSMSCKIYKGFVRTTLHLTLIMQGQRCSVRQSVKMLAQPPTGRTAACQGPDVPANFIMCVVAKDIARAHVSAVCFLYSVLSS
jgi:hypothetical protein